LHGDQQSPVVVQYHPRQRVKTLAREKKRRQPAQALLPFRVKPSSERAAK